MNAPQIHYHPGPTIPEQPLAEGLPSPESMCATAERADARLYLTETEGRIIAHAALWWNESSLYQGGRVGAIGGFAALDEAAALTLLEHATERLRDEGCRLAVGPMNGNTWRRYRYVTSGDARGPFLLEPRNPATYPSWWRSAGFSDLSHYSSSVIRLDGRRVVSPEMRQRLEESGIVGRILAV